MITIYTKTTKSGDVNIVVNGSVVRSYPYEPKLIYGPWSVRRENEAETKARAWVDRFKRAADGVFINEAVI
jgi:hypothetical protein